MRLSVEVNNGDLYFYQERLSSADLLIGFDCGIEEYNKYLIQDALPYQDSHLALTWLLLERTTGELVAYMSLISDAVKLSLEEKELHSLKCPFKTVPAIKLAKLAVSQQMRGKYEGVGTFMINNALRLARFSEQYFACRFLTVDADIEHNESVAKFYLKNGFYKNKEMNNKSSKTISMRKDIWE
jgi:ribosomal protein S18 acetylase RimI-like enzyme